MPHADIIVLTRAPFTGCCWPRKGTDLCSAVPARGEAAVATRGGQRSVHGLLLAAWGGTDFSSAAPACGDVAVAMHGRQHLRFANMGKNPPQQSETINQKLAWKELS